MAAPVRKSPVLDTVPKINNEVAVGEDVEFQRKWWKFEKSVWVVFTILVILDLVGAFGRGPLAKAHRQNKDLRISYERIERTGTPSVLNVQFSESAIRDGQIQLWASEDLVTRLGNKQVAPQPATSIVGKGGILYTFPATQQPAEAVFSLQPSAPGLYRLAFQTPGAPEVQFKILVMP